MAASSKSGPGKFSFRVALLQEMKPLFAGFFGEGLVHAIPAGWVVKMAELLPKQLLTNNDTRLLWATGIGLVLDGLASLGSVQIGDVERMAFQNLLVQIVEEIGKREGELNQYGSTKDRKVIRESMNKHKGELEPSRAKRNAHGNEEVLAVEQRHDVLHLIGTLTQEESNALWRVVAVAQEHLNEEQRESLHREKLKLEPGDALAGDEVMRLVNRAALTREQITGIIKAPKAQQRDALIDALRHAPSASDTEKSLEHLWTRVIHIVETALPTSGGAGKLRQELEKKLAELKKDNEDLAGF